MTAFFSTIMMVGALVDVTEGGRCLEHAPGETQATQQRHSIGPATT
jgi:hypothetical protein